MGAQYQSHISWNRFGGVGLTLRNYRRRWEREEVGKRRKWGKKEVGNITGAKNESGEIWKEGKEELGK